MISVDTIILAWDRIDDTIAAIESALAQTGVDNNVVIVDQGSKPEALARLKEFCAGNSRITLFCNSENNGVPGGRNQASFAGTGRYIVALDNDAVFADDRQLATMADIMEADTALGVLAFRIKQFDEDRDDRSSWPYSEALAGWSARAFRTVRFVGAGHAIRRVAFEKVSGYDDRLFFLHEEVDLAKRIINVGYTIQYDPRVVVRHKVSAEHRVAWNDKRYYYDVRNKLYLHVKHGTAFPTLVFHTGLSVMKGMRSGFHGGTFKGFFHALVMIPGAIRQRLRDPYVKTTPASAAYLESCSPTAGMAAMQRIRMRLRDASRKV